MAVNCFIENKNKAERRKTQLGAVNPKLPPVKPCINIHRHLELQNDAEKKIRKKEKEAILNLQVCDEVKSLNSDK